MAILPLIYLFFNQTYGLHVKYVFPYFCLCVSQMLLLLWYFPLRPTCSFPRGTANTHCGMSHIDGSFLLEDKSVWDTHFQRVLGEQKRWSVSILFSSGYFRNVCTKNNQFLQSRPKSSSSAINCLGALKQKWSMNRVADIKLYCTCDYYCRMMIGSFFNICRRGWN